MSTKQLSQKNIKASISVGDKLLMPYTDSVVFADFEGEELYVLIKDRRDPENNVKIFFKEETNFEVVEDEPKEEKKESDEKTK